MNTLTIVGRNKSEELFKEFSYPLHFTKIGIQEFSMEVSWDNISELYENNTFSYWNGNKWSKVILTDAFYTLERLNIRLKKYFMIPKKNLMNLYLLFKLVK